MWLFVFTFLFSPFSVCSTSRIRCYLLPIGNVLGQVIEVSRALCDVLTLSPTAELSSALSCETKWSRGISMFNELHASPRCLPRWVQLLGKSSGRNEGEWGKRALRAEPSRLQCSTQPLGDVTGVTLLNLGSICWQGSYREPFIFTLLLLK